VLGVRAATPNVTVLAEAGRYPLQVFAAKMLLKYWNRLVCREDDRLAKRAFLVSAALAGTTQGRWRHNSWAGQAATVLESLGLPCELAAPAVVDAEKGVSSLNSAYLSTVTDSELTKVQQYCARGMVSPLRRIAWHLIGKQLVVGDNAKRWASCAQARTGWQWSPAAMRVLRCIAVSACASAAAAARSTMRHTWSFGVQRSACSSGSTRACSHRGQRASAVSWDRTRRRWPHLHMRATRRS